MSCVIISKKLGILSTWTVRRRKWGRLGRGWGDRWHSWLVGRFKRVPRLNRDLGMSLVKRMEGSLGRLKER